jgi:hypothetical protein
VEQRLSCHRRGGHADRPAAAVAQRPDHQRQRGDLQRQPDALGRSGRALLGTRSMACSRWSALPCCNPSSFSRALDLVRRQPRSISSRSPARNSNRPNRQSRNPSSRPDIRPPSRAAGEYRSRVSHGPTLSVADRTLAVTTDRSRPPDPSGLDLLLLRPGGVCHGDHSGAEPCSAGRYAFVPERRGGAGDDRRHHDRTGSVRARLALVE